MVMVPAVVVQAAVWSLKWSSTMLMGRDAWGSFFSGGTVWLVVLWPHVSVVMKLHIPAIRVCILAVWPLRHSSSWSNFNSRLSELLWLLIGLISDHSTPVVISLWIVVLVLILLVRVIDWKADGGSVSVLIDLVFVDLLVAVVYVFPLVLEIALIALVQVWWRYSWVVAGVEAEDLGLGVVILGWPSQSLHLDLVVFILVQSLVEFPIFWWSHVDVLGFVRLMEETILRVIVLPLPELGADLSIRPSWLPDRAAYSPHLWPFKPGIFIECVHLLEIPAFFDIVLPWVFFLLIWLRDDPVSLFILGIHQVFFSMVLEPLVLREVYTGSIWCVLMNRANISGLLVLNTFIWRISVADHVTLSLDLHWSSSQIWEQLLIILLEFDVDVKILVVDVAVRRKLFSLCSILLAWRHLLAQLRWTSQLIP